VLLLHAIRAGPPSAFYLESLDFEMGGRQINFSTTNSENFREQVNTN
jgi:hypothetical protein